MTFVACTVGFVLSPARQWLTFENVTAWIHGIAALWYAPVIFVALFAVCSVLFVPASVFVLAAGILWGWVIGTVYSFLGLVSGAVASYYVSRYLGRDLFAKFGTRAQKIEHFLESAGFRALLILRLTPIFPFALLNYASGVAGVKPRDYIAATALGVIPSALVFNYLADSIAHGLISKEQAAGRFFVVALLVLAGVVIPMLLKKRAAKALHIDPDTVAEIEP